MAHDHLIGFLEASRSIAHDRLDKRLARKTSFEIARLFGLLVIVGITFDIVFSLPDWQRSERFFEDWKNEHAETASILTKRLDALSTPTQTLRTNILAELTAKNIDFSTAKKVNDLYQRIHDEIGIVPHELATTIDYFKGLRDTRADTPISELDKIEVSEGSWTSNRRISLKEQIAIRTNKHPLLAAKFAEAEKTASTLGELSNSLIEIVESVQTKHATLIKLWSELINTVPGWANWSVEDFRNLTDEPINAWLDILSPLDPVAKQELISRMQPNQSLSSATVVVQKYFEEKRALEPKEETSASIFSVPISLPRAEILLVTPFLWILSVGVVRFMNLGVGIARLELWRIESKLSDLVGEASSVGQFIGNEIVKERVNASPQTKWQLASFYSSNPNFFIDLTLSVSAWALIVFALERWLRLIFSTFFSEWGFFGSTCLAILFLFVLASEIFTRRAVQLVWRDQMSETDPK